MSADLRIFLISRMLSSRYQISVHRNFSTVFEKLDDFERSGDSTVSIIHVGTDRPETNEIDILIEGLTHTVLATEPALLVLPTQYTAQAKLFGSIPENETHSKLDVYFIPSEVHGDLDGGIPKAAPTREDFRGTVEFVMDLLLTTDDEQYHAKRSRIPDDLQTRLDGLRANCLYPQFSRYRLNPNSIFHFLQDVDPKFLDTGADCLEVGARTHNVLNEYGVKQIGDLLQYDLETVLKWKNFGRKSLQDLLNALINLGREWSNLDQAESQQEANKFNFIIPDDLQTRLDGLPANCLHPQFSRYGSEPNSIFHFLQDVDPKFLDTGAGRLEVPIRTHNVLKLHGVKRIGDLLQYDLETVLKWKNFGKKSLQDLVNALTNLGREWSNLDQADSQQEVNKFKFIKSVCDELERAGSRSMYVIQKRMGWYGKVETLEEIGLELGVTRERIRQIEKKAIGKLLSYSEWIDKVGAEIEGLLTERKEPLFIDLLEMESPVFEGASNYACFVGNIISEISGKKYSVLEIDGRVILSRISYEKWVQLNIDLRKSLEGKVNTSFTTDDLAILVESLLAQDGAIELKGKLIESVSTLANFSTAPDGQTVLVSFGKAVPAWVEVVLHEAESPLHFTQIWERCQKLAGRSMDVRRVHGAVAVSDAWYFGRGIYGLSHHSHLSPDEMNDFMRESENILLQNEHRQWHVGEILEELMTTRPDSSEGIDKFILNNILKASSLLKYLGRSIWVSVDNDRKRIDISAALETLLEEAGRPITVTELESRLRSRRGLSGFTLCSPTARLARVSPGTWGLIDRDFLIAENERLLLKDDLYRILGVHEKALHYTQLRDELQSIGNKVPAELTDYMIASIAQGDSRFRVYYGRLLGLAEWGNSRCLSIEEGLSTVLQSLTLPATLDHIRSSVESVLERRVTSNAIYSLLPRHGLIYDEVERAWVASGQMTEEDAGDLDYPADKDSL